MYISSSKFHHVIKVDILETINTPQDLNYKPFNVTRIKLTFDNDTEHEISIFGKPEITYTKLGE